MTHFVAHNGLNFLGKGPAEKIVIQSDSHRVAETANVPAHAAWQNEAIGKCRLEVLKDGLVRATLHIRFIGDSREI